MGLRFRTPDQQPPPSAPTPPRTRPRGLSCLPVGERRLLGVTPPSYPLCLLAALLLLPPQNERLVKYGILLLLPHHRNPYPAPSKSSSQSSALLLPPPLLRPSRFPTSKISSCLNSSPTTAPSRDLARDPTVVPLLVRLSRVRAPSHLPFLHLLHFLALAPLPSKYPCLSSPYPAGSAAITRILARGASEQFSTDAVEVAHKERGSCGVEGERGAVDEDEGVEGGGQRDGDREQLHGTERAALAQMRLALEETKAKLVESEKAWVEAYPDK
ncbi:hypothetical protein MVEN_00934300 [Mycena venus]|uniref:Uncharacterized protein n=1 Tax=Mycena venus TaxID=2733690 RepID=A0A8H6YDI3_9AGAR|nr:hypothetical protein MVEN_00934300 [Mycena venus]